MNLLRTLLCPFSVNSASGRLDMTQTPLDQAITLAMAGLGFGEVVSYSDVARRAGHPRAHRAVGRFLKTTKTDVPWWRVVRASGHLPPINPDAQARLLRDEGVVVEGDRVVKSPQGRFSQ
ncbi:MAG: hypothetical protein Aurels2KO_32700 [Aureliella sp.]